MFGELLIALMMAVVVVFYYSKPGVKPHVAIAAVGAFTLGLLSVLLVVTDMQGTEDLVFWWRVVYWTQFAMSFAVIPFLIRYELNDYISNDRAF